ncbi:DNA-binding MarR family transcriptional regulator [Amycolatopsis endophytica]|uniref:DNA-binding MarR family transcriptional regulator n=1 Tax=Amycolatopsis endophytica TaxID=860233 RepID=A0A853B571_9PSEU|nr:MarR family transcriptional regulator [Amycolatopsis endophytica]NYI89952.1 DNA-binding MarR family transcriptional regulator [Amycolatopsis endophytica]
MTAVDEAVFHVMRRALQEHGALWQAELPTLTKPQYAVLLVIAEGDDVDQATAGQRAAIDKATLANLMLRLESRGLITRSIGSDRRRRILRLTEEGRAVLRQAQEVAARVNGVVLGRLTVEEREALRGLLLKLSPSS